MLVKLVACPPLSWTVTWPVYVPAEANDTPLAITAKTPPPSDSATAEPQGGLTVKSLASAKLLLSVKLPSTT